ncbi:hypothetical protein R8510_05153 [Ralstonia chuxiongensis]|nr:hypothetical protein R8510_05153 [Ralstonia chuxiongensis]
MTHFRETEFVAEDGAPIIGAFLYDLDVWGDERLRLMVRSVLAECLQSMPHVRTEDVGVVLLTAQTGGDGLAPLGLVDELDALGDGSLPGLGPFHPKSCLCAYGKAGIGRALMNATDMLVQPDHPKYVALVAVDSLLHAAAIEHYLSYERVATVANPDGFAPAEGAAVVLLTLDGGDGPSLWIDACSIAEETWRIDADLPLRADALTQAIRSAASIAGTEIAALDFHASGMSGEGWYAKDVSIAFTRALERRAPDFDHHMIARTVGETGAAASVLTLAWLADAMGREWGGNGAAPDIAPCFTLRKPKGSALRSSFGSATTTQSADTYQQERAACKLTSTQTDWKSPVRRQGATASRRRHFPIHVGVHPLLLPDRL